MTVTVLVVSVAVVKNITSVAMSVLNYVASALPVVVIGWGVVVAEAKYARGPSLMTATDGMRDSWVVFS